MKRIVVGISGASGAVYGYTALQALRAAGGIETHLVVTASAHKTIALETTLSMEEFERLADVVYRDDDLAAAIASGSFHTDGMLVIPCSMKSASAIAASYDGTLLVRAADVSLKERRPLVLVVRETPLHLGHLRLLTQLAEVGAIILPPIPAMYAKPQSVQDIVAHTVGKALDQLRIPNELFTRWK
jgi:flavin prenyltransferase